jgi:hypothetical protein
LNTDAVTLLGRPVRTVYLAGKVARSRWRDEIVSYREGAWSAENHGVGAVGGTSGNDEDWQVVGGIVRVPDGPSLAYSGPYWRSLGRFGGHGNLAVDAAGLHANGDIGAEDHHGSTAVVRPRELAVTIREAILRADLVFAWIASRETFGTLVEVGFAAASGRLVVVAAPRFDRELWLAGAFAHRFIRSASPGAAWSALWGGRGDDLPDLVAGKVPSMDMREGW